MEERSVADSQGDRGDRGEQDLRHREIGEINENSPEENSMINRLIFSLISL